MKFEIYGQEIMKYEGEEEVIIIPKEIKSLGDFSFSNAIHLKKVILHDEVEEIGSYCFYNCDSLVEIEIPDSVRYIGGGAFSACRSLRSIQLPKYLRNINKSLFYKSDKLSSISLPDYIQTIDHDAFAYCKSLKEIILPNQLKSIMDSAFEECESLTQVVLPESVKKLGKKVFFHCLNLHHIELSSSLEEVGEGAFQTHSLLSIQTKNKLVLTSKMFDCNWNFDWGYSFKMKNGDNYNLTHSFIPYSNIQMYKPVAKIVLLVNYLETFNQHTHPNTYDQHLEEHKKEVLDFIVSEERFDALNNGLDHQVIIPDELEPYLDRINDREQKAKLLQYNQKKDHHALDDLDDLLDDLF